MIVTVVPADAMEPVPASKLPPVGSGPAYAAEIKREAVARMEKLMGLSMERARRKVSSSPERTIIIVSFIDNPVSG